MSPHLLLGLGYWKFTDRSCVAGGEPVPARARRTVPCGLRGGGRTAVRGQLAVQVVSSPSAGRCRYGHSHRDRQRVYRAISMCRKRSFATGGRGRLPASAAVPARETTHGTARACCACCCNYPPATGSTGPRGTAGHPAAALASASARHGPGVSASTGDALCFNRGRSLLQPGTLSASTGDALCFNRG